MANRLTRDTVAEERPKGASRRMDNIRGARALLRGEVLRFGLVEPADRWQSQCAAARDGCVPAGDQTQSVPEETMLLVLGLVRTRLGHNCHIKLDFATKKWRC